MNASNNFTVVGFICKDTEVRNFEKSSIALFFVSTATTEKKGGVEITSSSIQSFETWIKNDDQALLDYESGCANQPGVARRDESVTYARKRRLTSVYR